MSVQVYILIQTEVGKAASVAKSISAIPGVTLAEGVTGPYDVIMRAESPSMEDLGRTVLAKVQAVPGITRTLTCPVTGNFHSFCRLCLRIADHCDYAAVSTL